jgi:hypothetical protein
MQIRKSLLGALIALGLATPALACGPDLPPDLLHDRKTALLELPEGTFAFEAAHLVSKPAGNLPVVEHADWIWSDPPAPTRDAVERGWLGDGYEKVLTMRAQTTGASAYAAGNGLPDDARLYTAGAVAYQHDDREAASKYFLAVLALPAPQRPHYGVLAQYMLADLSGTDMEAAQKAYRATRALVEAGAVDPLGLAVTSFGEEARLSMANGEYANAVGLYARQAATGSAFGRTSLLFVARDLAKDPAKLDTVVTDPVAQRLLAAYLYSRVVELDYPEDDASQKTSGAVAKDERSGQQVIARFLAAVEKHGLDHVEGAHRLAAVAYRHGDFDLAKKFAAKSESGLSWWVRAKLALRDGDTAHAAEAYAAASKAFPKDERWADPATSQYYEFEALQPSCRVADEHGMLALARGDYVNALELMYAAARMYWPDTAYVAERVVSVDELKTFVDAKVAAAPPPPAAKPDEGPAPASTATQMRALLARRLLRAERYDEALKYFDDAELKKKAEAYVQARRDTARTDPIDAARAWYQAAVAARTDGIDLIGFELDPDYQEYGGSYDVADFNYDPNAEGETVQTALRKDIKLPADFVGKDEQSRVSASRAEPLKRFHYRYVAAGFAEKSADLLPRRSQAFAAVLCSATHWVIHSDADAGAKIYQRYVKQGPYVKWGKDFGETCPEPNFESAAARLKLEKSRALKRQIRHAAPYLGGGLLLLVGGLAAWFVRRRRAAKTA